jgi:dephospho-CoA kinase
MLQIGLTGGLGSGKTTVARYFEELGIPVFYADDEAKKITDTSDHVRDQLITEFGPELYDNEQLNRPALAEIIFNNEAAIQIVNDIIHPAVRQEFQRWAFIQHAPYVLEEAAILFETGEHRAFDKTILVTAPEALRIERVMKRSTWTEEEARSRMKNQWDESHKIPLADFVILNDGTEPLGPQISDIHERILRIANQGG